MDLAKNKTDSPRLRALRKSILRFGQNWREWPRKRPQQARAEPAFVAGSTHDSTRPSRTVLLSQVRAGLRSVERQHELLDRQLAERRYYHALLAEYMDHVAADINALEQGQAQFESMAAELRQAERNLTGEPIPAIGTQVQDRQARGR